MYSNALATHSVSVFWHISCYISFYFQLWIQYSCILAHLKLIWVVFNPLFFFAERPVQPYISLYFKWAPYESTEVFKGHRFAIFCKNVSPYKALSIRLKTGVYTQHPSEHIQSPVDNEAVFMFPAAEDAHQGTYQCDYNFDFSPEVFSKPSTTFVTVKGKPEFINASCGKNLDIAFNILSEAVLNVGNKSFI